MRKWLAETHGTNFELVRHFFACMFDSELFSARGEWRGAAIGALAMALPAGMTLMDSPYFYKGLDRITNPETLRAGALADQMAWLILAFSITGMVGLLAWQSLFPSRRDYLLFAGLPVRPRQIFLARFASVVLFALGLVTALNLLPSFIAPHQFTAAWSAGIPLGRFAAASLGCCTVFFSIVSLQGLLLNLVPGRWFLRVSTLVQGVLTGGFLLAALSAWFVVDMGPAPIRTLITSPVAAFPVWFSALTRVLSGDTDAFFALPASRALVASVCAPALAAITYLVAYRRAQRLLIESPEAKMAPKRRGNFFRWLAGSPRQEAVLQFLAATVARSSTHRLIVLGYLGAGLALMLNAVLLLGGRFGGAVDRLRILQFVVLYWPIGITAIMMAGVKHAFLIPAELRANWIFRASESQGLAEWMSAVERFVLAGVVLPVFVVLGPAAVYVMGWTVAARMTILQIIIAVSIFDVLFYSWQQLPFACSYAPGKRPLVAWLGIWLYVLGVIVPVLSILVATLSQMAWLFWFGAPVLGAAWLWLRHRRREGWGASRLIYEDLPAAVADIGIRDIRPTKAIARG